MLENSPVDYTENFSSKRQGLNMRFCIYVKIPNRGSLRVIVCAPLSISPQNNTNPRLLNMYIAQNYAKFECIREYTDQLCAMITYQLIIVTYIVLSYTRISRNTICLHFITVFEVTCVIINWLKVLKILDIIYS